jgi:hypothetical protein
MIPDLVRNGLFGCSNLAGVAKPFSGCYAMRNAAPGLLDGGNRNRGLFQRKIK